MKRIIYCGSRDWIDRQMIRAVMQAIVDRHGAHIVVHGAQRGADTQASLVALGLGLVRDPFPADWNNAIPRHLAGHQRNQRMLDTGPILVVAFKDSFDFTLSHGGTEDMIARATLAGVPARLYSHDGEADPAEAHEDEAPALAARLQRLREGTGASKIWQPV